jgi:hypothetical protein
MEALINANEWAGIAALAIVVAGRVAVLTKTKKDDYVVGLLHKVLSVVGLKFPEVK